MVTNECTIAKSTDAYWDNHYEIEGYARVAKREAMRLACYYADSDVVVCRECDSELVFAETVAPNLVQ